MRNGLVPLVLVAIASTSCDSATDSPFLFREAGRAIEQDAEDVGGMTLEYVRTWGASIGPSSFASIGAVGVSDAGLLAVNDASSCEIALFALETDSMVARFGRCGQGPGDIPRVADISFSADTIVLHDGAARLLHFILPTGEELRRVPIPHLNEHGGIQSLFLIGSDTVVASRRFMAGSSLGDASEEDRQLIVYATVDPPRVLGSGLTFPAVMDHHRGNFEAGYAACLRPGNDARYVGILNRWAYEAVILNIVGMEPISRTVTNLGWGEPLPDQRMSGVLMPHVGAVGVACSQEWVLFSQLRLEGEGRQTRVVGGHIEVRDYSGLLKANLNLGPADSLLFGTPVAAHENRVFFRANRLAAFPQITEFRLVPLNDATARAW